MTCSLKYGEKYFTKTKSYLKKAKETTMRKYGVEFTSQIPTHKEKTEKHFQKNMDINTIHKRKYIKINTNALA